MIPSGNPEAVGHPNQLRQRTCAHLMHDLSALNGHCNRAISKFCGGLFIRKTSDDKWENFLFPGSQPTVPPSQLRRRHA